MIPSMEPAIVSSETCRREFVEPLSRADALLVDSVIALYDDQACPGCPPMKFRMEHFRVVDGKRISYWVTTLIYPKSIRKVFPIPQLGAKPIEH